MQPLQDQFRIFQDFLMSGSIPHIPVVGSPGNGYVVSFDQFWQAEYRLIVTEVRFHEFYPAVSGIFKITENLIQNRCAIPVGRKFAGIDPHMATKEDSVIGRRLTCRSLGNKSTGHSCSGYTSG